MKNLMKDILSLIVIGLLVIPFYVHASGDEAAGGNEDFTPIISEGEAVEWMDGKIDDETINFYIATKASDKSKSPLKYVVYEMGDKKGNIPYTKSMKDDKGKIDEAKVVAALSSHLAKSDESKQKSDDTQIVKTKNIKCKSLSCIYDKIDELIQKDRRTYDGNLCYDIQKEFNKLLSPENIKEDGKSLAADITNWHEESIESEVCEKVFERAGRLVTKQLAEDLNEEEEIDKKNDEIQAKATAEMIRIAHTNPEALFNMIDPITRKPSKGSIADIALNGIQKNNEIITEDDTLKELASNFGFNLETTVTSPGSYMIGSFNQASQQIQNKNFDLNGGNEDFRRTLLNTFDNNNSILAQMYGVDNYQNIGTGSSTELTQDVINQILNLRRTQYQNSRRLGDFSSNRVSPVMNPTVEQMMDSILSTNSASTSAYDFTPNQRTGGVRGPIL